MVLIMFHGISAFGDGGAGSVNENGQVFGVAASKPPEKSGILPVQLFPLH
jgi:hypothetical protein